MPTKVVTTDSCLFCPLSTVIDEGAKADLADQQIIICLREKKEVGKLKDIDKDYMAPWCTLPDLEVSKDADRFSGRTFLSR